MRKGGATLCFSNGLELDGWMDATHCRPDRTRWLVGLLAVLALARRRLMQMGTINIQQVTKSRGWSDAQKESAFIPLVSAQLFFFCPRRAILSCTMASCRSLHLPFILSSFLLHAVRTCWSQRTFIATTRKWMP